jgi:hypothetical protein
VALSFSLISVDPPIVLFLLLLAYGLSGYIHGALSWYRHWRSRDLPKTE